MGKRRQRSSGPKTPDSPKADAPPRIIGGRFRGKRLIYSGDSRTRPMKERVREAAFNLIGPVAKDTLAIDLFAGTGALGLEALSRGASHAVFIERHFPTAKSIHQNIENLGVADVCQVHSGDTFHWTRHRLKEITQQQPWLVFCSPPYAFYDDRRDDMLQLLTTFQQQSPQGSTLVAEFDTFSPDDLPDALSWDARRYPPAVIAIWRKPV